MAGDTILAGSDASEALKRKLYSQLKSTSVLTALKGQLRAQLLGQLQKGADAGQHPPLRPPPAGSSAASARPGSLWARAMDALVAQHLESRQLQFSLSVFEAEAGLQEARGMSGDEVCELLRLRGQPELEQGLRDAMRGSRSMGAALLAATAQAGSGQPAAEVACQTDTPAAHTLSRQLRALEDAYLVQSAAAVAAATAAAGGAAPCEARATGAVVRPLQGGEAECVAAEVAAAVARVRDVEVEAARQQEAAKWRRLLDQQRVEADALHQERLARLVAREEAMQDKLRRTQREVERVAYEQRQRILREELRMQEARQAAAAQLAEQRALLEGLEAGLHERAAAVELWEASVEPGAAGGHPLSQMPAAHVVAAGREAVAGQAPQDQPRSVDKMCAEALACAAAHASAAEASRLQLARVQGELHALQQELARVQASASSAGAGECAPRTAPQPTTVTAGQQQQQRAGELEAQLEEAVTAREQAAVDTAAARREAALARQQLERLQQEVHVWRLSAASAMGSPRRQLAAGAAAGPWGSPGMEARAVGPAGMGGWGQHAEPAYRQQQAPPSPLVPRHFHEQSAQQASTAHIPAAQQAKGSARLADLQREDEAVAQQAAALREQLAARQRQADAQLCALRAGAAATASALPLQPQPCEPPPCVEHISPQQQQALQSGEPELVEAHVEAAASAGVASLASMLLAQATPEAAATPPSPVAPFPPADAPAAWVEAALASAPCSPAVAAPRATSPAAAAAAQSAAPSCASPPPQPLPAACMSPPSPAPAPALEAVGARSPGEEAATASSFLERPATAGSLHGVALPSLAAVDSTGRSVSPPGMVASQGSDPSSPPPHPQTGAVDAGHSPAAAAHAAWTEAAPAVEAVVDPLVLPAAIYGGLCAYDSEEEEEEGQEGMGRGVAGGVASSWSWAGGEPLAGNECELRPSLSGGRSCSEGEGSSLGEEQALEVYGPGGAQALAEGGEEGEEEAEVELPDDQAQGWAHDAGGWLETQGGGSAGGSSAGGGSAGSARPPLGSLAEQASGGSDLIEILASLSDEGSVF